MVVYVQVGQIWSLQGTERERQGDVKRNLEYNQITLNLHTRPAKERIVWGSPGCLTFKTDPRGPDPIGQIASPLRQPFAAHECCSEASFAACGEGQDSRVLPLRKQGQKY